MMNLVGKVIVDAEVEVGSVRLNWSFAALTSQNNMAEPITGVHELQRPQREHGYKQL